MFVTKCYLLAVELAGALNVPPAVARSNLAAAYSEDWHCSAEEEPAVVFCFDVLHRFAADAGRQDSPAFNFQQFDSSAFKTLP